MEFEMEKKEFLQEFGQSAGNEAEAQNAIELMLSAYRNEGPGREKRILHNIGVATIVLRLGLERNVVVAGLLHNAMQHGVSTKTLQDSFRKEIFDLIDSKDRFEKALTFHSKEKEMSRKKLHIVLTTNPPVVMLQISEMLDKLRRIEMVPEHERENFIEEITDVYAPLCHKLGIYSISSEMNDLAFNYKNPGEYRNISAQMAQITKQTTSAIEKAKALLFENLKKNDIRAGINGRIKTVYSTYSKMKRKNAGIEQVYDLIALRVVTNSVKECYEALGILHSMWKPIPGEFDDYIVKPKDNGYRSLHTSVYTDEKTPLEIQIRTKEMNDFAELGIAAHWRYKGEKNDHRYDKKIGWIKQVLEWGRSARTNTELNMFGKEVFALTPKGELIELPEGATVIDFAYAVHSDIGDKCMGAKINSIMVSLDTKIRNGDVVEVVTSSRQTPKINWLTFAKTGKARQKIMGKLHMDKGRQHTTPHSIGNCVKTNNTKVRLAKCCNPLPGERIIGIRTTKRKISVHRVDCKELLNIKIGRVDVKWDDKISYYDTTIIVHAQDRLGVLRDILEVFSQNKIYVGSANATASASNTALCRFIVRLRDLEQLESIKKKIANIKGVTRVSRE